MEPRTLGTLHLVLAAAEALGVLAAGVMFVVSVGVCSGVLGATSADAGDGWVPGLVIGGVFGALIGFMFVVLAMGLVVAASSRVVGGLALRRGEPGPIPVITAAFSMLIPLMSGGLLFLMSPAAALGLMPLLLLWILGSVALLVLVIQRPAPKPHDLA